MCGIAGQFHFAREGEVRRATLERMTESLKHRGPDDQGIFLGDGVGFGFRRLSIIDLEGGRQPMADATGTVVVAFNGEIYNFRELRAELQSHGHTFATCSDTEVIVHGYKQWGTGVLDRLRGMFGVAIWDALKHRLVLARDATGIKLVYFHVAEGVVTFASEVRAILASLTVSPGIDGTAVNLFLRYRYTPSPLTILSGIRKLPPGGMAVFERGKWSLERWYRYQPTMVDGSELSDDAATDQLLHLYDRAVARHLVSDVPVGLLLSGGMDSGLLLGLMRNHGDRWPTYTVGYGMEHYKDDELSEAAATAAHFGSENTAVRLGSDEFDSALPRIVAALEEPVASASIVPMYFVCERARRDVKVALIGQGPDELFGGYTRHLGIRYGDVWRRIPSWLRNGVGRGVNRLPRNEALKRGVYALGLEERMRRYQGAFSIASAEVIDGLFRDGVLPAGAGDTVLGMWSDLESEMRECDELTAFQVLELRSSLPDELLMYADKLSMAHGLEVRVPYLDRDVVEYAERLPATFKIRRGRRKWIHRRVCRQFLPATVLQRKKKGFAVDVVDDWFRRSLVRRSVDYLVDPQSRIFEFLRPERVKTLFEEHRAGRHDHHKLLFSLVVLEECLRTNYPQANVAATAAG